MAGPRDPDRLGLYNPIPSYPDTGNIVMGNAPGMYGSWSQKYGGFIQPSGAPNSNPMGYQVFPEPGSVLTEERILAQLHDSLAAIAQSRVYSKQAYGEQRQGLAQGERQARQSTNASAMERGIYDSGARLGRQRDIGKSFGLQFAQALTNYQSNMADLAARQAEANTGAKYGLATARATPGITGPAAPYAQVPSAVPASGPALDPWWYLKQPSPYGGGGSYRNR
jgi:hypothetical protein